MKIQRPDNLIPKIEMMYPEVEKSLKKRPNRLRCSPQTYMQLCRDAQEYFDRETMHHVSKLYGMTVVVQPDIQNGVVLCDYADSVPKA